MVKININYGKCPYCGAKKQARSLNCPRCGKNLSNHQNTFRLMKKVLKGSGVLVKSLVSRKYREKTINNMMGKASGFDFVNMNNMGNFSNKNSKDSGYLLCDSCPVYYKLDHPLGPEDPKECGCGGKLIFSSKPRYND
jgi:endogenous inhibitor of DNA gyrase (YacG/DUF329 family)